MPLHQTSSLSVNSDSSSVAAGAASSASAAGGDDLSQFVAAFKEMAHNLDEEGARNLLVWSPLFLPTVEGLMRNGGEPGARRPKPKLKSEQPREVRHPAPHPRDQEVRAERLEHMNKLRAMYQVDQPPPPPPAAHGHDDARGASLAPPVRQGSAERARQQTELVDGGRSSSERIPSFALCADFAAPTQEELGEEPLGGSTCAGLRETGTRTVSNFYRML